MKRYLRFDLGAQQGSVIVEVEEPQAEEGIERAARAPELAARAGQTFEAALENIKPIARAVLTKVQDLSEALDEVNVEFGLKLDAKAGVLIASGGVEANFKIVLTWKR
jgi:hypothetical protein